MRCAGDRLPQPETESQYASVYGSLVTCQIHGDTGGSPGWGRVLDNARSPIPDVFILPILECAWAVSSLQVASGKGVVARNCKLLMSMQASHRVFAPELK